MKTYILHLTNDPGKAVTDLTEREEAENGHVRKVAQARKRSFLAPGLGGHNDDHWRQKHRATSYRAWPAHREYFLRPLKGRALSRRDFASSTERSAQSDALP